MHHVNKALLMAGWVLAAGCSIGSAAAQSDEFAPARGFGYGDPAYFNAPGINVPDQDGCVKWCFRDESPCDPPQYKRADNRCSNFQ